LASLFTPSEGRRADESGIRDRYQQFEQIARELLSDFREGEEKISGLD
jgi:hypothetical protein